MHVCMYVCMYVYMYVCIYVCVYVCMYVCMKPNFVPVILFNGWTELPEITIGVQSPCTRGLRPYA